MAFFCISWNTGCDEALKASGTPKVQRAMRGFDSSVIWQEGSEEVARKEIYITCFKYTETLWLAKGTT
jgi:hypothetical protein